MSAEPATILVIDDNPANLQLAVGHLQQYAYRVLTARQGEAGVDRARYALPDLILLDIDMPGIDGFEVCRRLKAHPETASIPVIYMTGISGADDKQRAFELGGVDYVTKPFEPSEFLARVRTHLDLASHKKRLAGEAERLEEQVANAVADRNRLLEMVRLQSDQLRTLTQRWLHDRNRRDQDLAELLRTELSERLALISGELKQARLLVRDQDAIDTIERALALLEPALQKSEEVEGRLSVVDAMFDNPLVRLSGREHEVFQLLVDGKSNKEIAGILDLAPTTVSTYRLRVLDKLGVEDIPALVRLSLRRA